MDYDFITNLIHLVEQSNLLEIEITHGDFKIKIVKQNSSTSAPVNIAPIPCTRNAHPSIFKSQKNHPSPDECSLTNSSEEIMIKSPMVGMFFRSSNPTAKAFVEIGSTVHIGKVLCIVEAMKLLNEIESDIAGEVIAILVENNQPVEYNQPLFIIRTLEK